MRLPDLRKLAEKYRNENLGMDTYVFDRLSSEIKAKKHLSYEDFLTIHQWKVGEANYRRLWEKTRKNKPIDVLKKTQDALSLAGQGKTEEALNILIGMPAVKIAVASAILTFAYPEKYGVIDQRAKAALLKLKITQKKSISYSEYCGILNELGARFQMRPREVDMALWQYASDNGLW